MDTIQMLNSCTLCPRSCKADRVRGNMGVCNSTDKIMVARAALHMWEEPCISGKGGSGAVFFSGCSLGCCFCQNKAISGGKAGKSISIERLCDIFFELAAKGAHNINLVTPDHYVPQIICAIDMAKKRGFYLPFVYNCSGYETPRLVQMLDGYIDIYLPDFKYMSADISERYSKAKNYSYFAKQAINEMVRQCGGEKTTFDDEGMMKKGVIVRHLALPTHIEDSKAIISYLYNTYKDDIFLSIMNQYTPMPGIDKLYPELNRKVSEQEYEELVDYAVALGVENGFIQEGDTADESFIPEFFCEGV